MHPYQIQITAEEAWNMASQVPVDLLFPVRNLYRNIYAHFSDPTTLDHDGWADHAFALAIFWNAARVQGIREERARRRTAQK